MRASIIITTVAGWLLILISSAWSQSPLSFYPYAQGNVWQYRDASTQEIVYRRYNDSVSISADSNIYIRARYLSPDPVIRLERIDTSFNLFLTTFQPDHPRYKFAADSGETWFAGYDPGDSSRHFEVTLSDIFEGYVFNVLTTIKEYTFNMIQFGGTDTLELGKEHLGAGFGLAFALIEGGSAPYLSGAIIDGVHWGEPIVSVHQSPDRPVEFLLHQNYPNPFNPQTTIQYQIPEDGIVVMKLYDVLGREVRTLVNEEVKAGYYSVTLDATQQARVYIFTESSRAVTPQRRKLVVMK
jgi:hypothetical protein